MRSSSHWRMALLTVLGLLLCRISLAQTAADKPRSETVPAAATTPADKPATDDWPKGFRRVFVPQGKPETWPAGDWRPVPLADFERLAAPPTHPAIPAATLSHAVYRATLTANRWDNGEFAWTVAPQATGIFHRLDPLSIALRDIKWGAEDAVWGDSDTGQTLLRVEPGASRTATGRWGAPGRRIVRSTVFEIEVPAAVLTEFVLKIPVGQRLSSNVGEVTRATPRGEEGFETWRVRWGRHVKGRLVVTEETAVNRRPVVLVRQGTVYRLHQEVIRFQTDTIAEVLESPVSELKFLIDPGIELISITYNNNVPLAWKTESDEVRVRLPEPLLGAKLPVHIEGLARWTGTAEQTLPQIRLADAILVGEVTQFGAGNVVLDVFPPLQLRRIETPGYRQTEVSLTEGVERIMLRQLQPDASVRLSMGRAELRASLKSQVQVQAAPDQWTADAVLDWSSRSGEAFLVQCGLPPQWELADVRIEQPGAAPGVSDPFSWDVVTAEGQQSRLEIRLREPLAPGRPYRCRASLRRPATAAGVPVAIPLLVPIGIEDVEHLATVISASTLRPIQSVGGTLDVVTPADLSADWPEPNWIRKAQSAGDRAIIFHSHLPAAQATFYLQADRELSEARATVSLKLTDDAVSETVDIRGTPHAGPLRHLLVYFAEAGPDWQWEQSDEPGKISASRLGKPAHLEWNLPATGDLWELRFDGPRSDAVHVTGTRTRRIAGAVQAALPFVPHAEAFQGQVIVAEDAKRVMRYLPRRLEALPRSTTQSSWRYSEPFSTSGLAQLTLQPPQETFLVPPVVITNFSGDMRFDNQSQALVDCDLRLQRFAAENDITFHLASDCTVLQARIDGQLARPTRDETLDVVGRTAWRLTLPGQKPEVRLQIKYRVTLAQLAGSHEIPLPVFQVPVWQTRLRTETPETHRLTEVWNAAAPPPSRSRVGSALFGPLLRDDGPLFAPWSARAWRSLLLFPRTIGEPAASTRAHSVGTALPESFRITIVGNARHDWLGWVGLLAGCAISVALRLSFPMISRRSGWIFTGTAVGLACCLPEPWGPLAGGFVAGRLLAVLIPDGWLVYSRKPRVAAPAGSTQSFVPTTAVLLLAASLVILAAASHAQDAVDVLVPIDAQGQLAGPAPLVYVPARLAGHFAPEKTDQQTPGALIESADYETTSLDDRWTVRARLSVWHDWQREVELRLPWNNPNFAGDAACLLDGRPVAIVLDESTGRVVINLPPLPADEDKPTGADAAASRWKRRVLEFVLNPRGDVQTTGGAFRIGVPPISGSRLSIVGAHPGDVSVRWSAANFRPAAESVNETVDLGRTTSWELSWSALPPSERTTAEVEARIQSVVERVPGLVRMQTRVEYKVLRGEVESVSWRLPPDVLVSDVRVSALTRDSGEPEPEILFQGTLPVADHQRWLLELARPARAPFAVTATLLFLVPPTAEITLPLVPMIDRQLNNTVTNVTGNLLALRSAPDTKLDARADSPTRFVARPIDEFVRLWTVEGPRPQAAYQIDPPLQIVLSAQPLSATVTAQPRWVGRFVGDQLQCEFSADLEFAGRPVFRHRLHVDPRLQITTVTVREGTAERQARWARSGAELNLFLTEGATRPQTVRVVGTLPWQRATPLELPRVQLLDSPAETNLSLWSAGDSQVDLEGTEKLNRADPSSPAPAGMNLIGSYRVPEAWPRLTARVIRTQPQIVSDQVQVLRTDAGAWKLTTEILIQLKSGRASRFDLELPRELARGAEVTTSQRAKVARRTLATGSERISLTLDDPVSDHLRVSVTASLAPTQTGIWEIPEIVVAGAEPRETLVLLPKVLGPQESDSGLGRRALPVSLKSLLPDLPDGANWDSFTVLSRPARIVFRSLQNSRPEAAVMLAESQVWQTDDHRSHGRSQFWLKPSSAETLDLLWPAGAQPEVLLIDGQVQPFPRPQGGRCSIPLPVRGVSHVIRMAWTRPPTSPQPSQQSLGSDELPRPAIGRADREWTTVIPPGGWRVQPAVDTEDAFLAALTRWETALELFELQQAASNPEVASASMRRDLVESCQSETEALAASRGVNEALRLTRLRQRTRDMLSTAANRVRAPSIAWPTRPAFAPEYRIGAAEKAVYWLFPQFWIPTAVGLFCGVVLAFFSWLATRRRWTGALQSQTHVCVTVMGLVWWLFLTWSAVGFLVFVVGLALCGVAALPSRKQKRSSTTIPVS